MLDTGFYEYDDRAAMEAVTVTGAMVDQGVVARLADDGSLHLAVKRGSGASSWSAFASGLEAITSGSWTPTGVTGTNVTGVDSERGDYIRVSNTVFFSATFSATHTAGAPTASAFSFDLPVTSDIAAVTDLNATVSGAQVSLGRAEGNATDNDCDVAYTIAASGAQVVKVTGSYRIL